MYAAAAAALALAVVLGTSIVIWAYKSLIPPPPKICGKPNGPPVTSPRIKLSNGRYLAYKEYGVSRESSKYRVIMVHGIESSKDFYLPLSQEFMEKVGLYIVTYDRPGYGESDPNPNRTVKSETLDLEEFADKLQLGSKFYLVGLSMGNYITWGFLRYIPHRQVSRSRACSSSCQLLVAIFSLEAKWFPSSQVMNRSPIIFSRHDLQTINMMMSQLPHQNQQDPCQQGDYESRYRDLKMAFASWEFDPMELENPFPENPGSVQLWQGYEDKLVPYQLQRFLAQKLPWINYHEVPDRGHLIIHEADICEEIFKSLLQLGEEPSHGQPS
ncbi:hypothetical protein Dimus_009385 [Dionaea muscipula]